jgi:hypothetical protein
MIVVYHQLVMLKRKVYALAARGGPQQSTDQTKSFDHIYTAFFLLDAFKRSKKDLPVQTEHKNATRSSSFQDALP